MSNIYLNWKDVAFNPGPLVHQVLDRHSEFSQGPSKFGDSSGPVADGDRELDEAAVGGETAFEASAQDRRVDVAAAEENDDTEKS